MDDDEYRELIDLVSAQLESAGAGDLADDRHYVRGDLETGERRVLDPRDQLIEMLRAFERFLSIQDKGTYEQALRIFGDVMLEAGPTTVLFVPTEGSRDVNPVKLDDAPDLRMVRKDLNHLIHQLLIDPEPSDHREPR